MTDVNDEVDNEAAHFGDHNEGHGWPTIHCDRTSQRRVPICTENRGALEDKAQRNHAAASPPDNRRRKKYDREKRKSPL